MWHSVDIVEFGDDAGRCLRLVDHEQLPPCGPSAVRLRVLAASASFTDIMVRRGVYHEAPKQLPYAPGYDLVGLVEEIGPECPSTSLIVGQRVAALTVWGSYTQQYVCNDPAYLVPVPDGLSDEVAVSLILAWLTAAQMLWRYGLDRDGSGKSILVHGASGSVGAALVVLAKLQGFFVIGSASGSKADFCRSIGCDVVVDYRSEDFVEVCARHGNVDAAFDMVSLENFKRSHQALKPKGLLVTYGFYQSSLNQGVLSIASEFLQNVAWSKWKSWTTDKRTEFYIITDMRKQHPDWFSQDLGELFQLAKEGKIHPAIFKVMPLREAAAAQELIANHQVEGKIVLNCQ